MKDCLFCKIVRHELTADIVFENEALIVFKDIHPKAKVHLLIAPKKHIESINHLKEDDKEMISQMFFIARDLAKKYNIIKDGYRLLFNVGRGAGQIIDHLHLHLMSGK